MSKKIHIGCSPITGEVFAGKLNKQGTMWIGDKQNVTNEAFNAVAQSLIIRDETMEFSHANGNIYALKVVKLKRKKL